MLLQLVVYSDLAEAMVQRMEKWMEWRLGPETESTMDEKKATRTKTEGLKGLRMVRQKVLRMDDCLAVW